MSGAPDQAAEMRVEVDVHRDAEQRLAGSVGGPAGEHVPFTGILGLVAAVERCLDQPAGSPVAAHTSAGNRQPGEGG